MMHEIKMRCQINIMQIMNISQALRSQLRCIILQCCFFRISIQLPYKCVITILSPSTGSIPISLTVQFGAFCHVCIFSGRQFLGKRFLNKLIIVEKPFICYNSNHRETYDAHELLNGTSFTWIQTILLCTILYVHFHSLCYYLFNKCIV